MIESYKAHGVVFRKQDSPYYKKDGTLDIINTVGILMRAILMAFAYCIMYFMQKTALSSGINTSIIVSIFSGCSFLSSLLFYIFFKEKLMIKHMIGMCLLVACILLISFSG